MNLPAINPKASVPAVLHEDWDTDPPGAFAFTDYGDNEDGAILFRCPCGCGALQSVHFVGRRAWVWDGNREAPTVTPSVLIYQHGEGGKITGEHWHGFLTAGQWVSC